MTDLPGEQPVVNEPPASGPQEDAINPAWNNLLEKLPEGFHGIVAPELKAWDANVQQLVGKVHSEYEPYKSFKDQGIDADALNEAYAIREAMQADPRAFMKAVSEFYGIELGQGQPPAAPKQEPNSEEVSEPDPFALESNPEFLRLKGMTEQMAQLTIAQQQEAKQKQEDAALETALSELKTKHGDFDVDYVLNKGMALGDLEKGVEAYQAMIQTAVAAHRNPSAGAPVVMGAGGGTPSQQIPANTLDGEGRKKLVATLLAQANAQGG